MQGPLQYFEGDPPPNEGSSSCLAGTSGVRVRIQRVPGTLADERENVVYTNVRLYGARLLTGRTLPNCARVANS